MASRSPSASEGRPRPEGGSADETPNVPSLPRAGQFDPRGAQAPEPATESVPDFGERFVYRVITPADEDLLSALFAGLTPRSRYQRFLSDGPRVADQNLRLLTKPADQNQCSWGAFVANREGRCVGVAQWLRYRGAPEVAEVALTVTDAYQNRGVGRALTALTMRSALAAGVKLMTGSVHSQNKAVLHMLDIAGARKRWISPEVLKFEVMPCSEGTDVLLPHNPLLESSLEVSKEDTRICASSHPGTTPALGDRQPSKPESVAV